MFACFYVHGLKKEIRTRMIRCGAFIISFARGSFLSGTFLRTIYCTYRGWEFSGIPFLFSELKVTLLEIWSGWKWFEKKKILLQKSPFIPTLVVSVCPKIVQSPKFPHTPVYMYMWFTLLCDFPFQLFRICFHASLTSHRSSRLTWDI